MGPISSPIYLQDKGFSSFPFFSGPFFSSTSSRTKKKGNTSSKRISYLSKSLKERDTPIGTFEVETYTNTESISKVYALGFKTTIDHKSNLFYLTRDSEDLNKDINISSDSYTKRSKIYDINGIWVDTKPLNFNDTAKN